MKISSIVTSSTKGIRFFAAIVAATMVGGLTTAMVMASVPNSTTGVIDGCYDSNGALRVIDTEASATCDTGETPVSWNGSNTMTLTKRASYDPSDPVATLLTIPGYGDIKVDPSRCNADNTLQAPVDFKNTSAGNVTIAGSNAGNEEYVLASNDTYTIGQQSVAYGNEQYFLTSAAAPDKIVSVRLSGYAPVNTNQTVCTYYAYVSYER